MIREIHLGGVLENLTDGPIKLKCNNLTQLFCALESQVPNFRKIKLQHDEWIILTVDENNNYKSVTQETMDLSWPKKHTRVFLAPNVEGSVPIVVGWLASIAITGTIATIIATVVVNVALAVVMSLLAPKPKSNAGKAAAQEDSFIFSGAVNVEGQGGPVPLVFGVCMTGSNVISSETFIEDMKKPVEQAPEPAAAVGAPTPMSPAWQGKYYDSGGGA